MRVLTVLMTGALTFALTSVAPADALLLDGNDIAIGDDLWDRKPPLLIDGNRPLPVATTTGYVGGGNIMVGGTMSLIGGILPDVSGDFILRVGKTESNEIIIVCGGPDLPRGRGGDANLILVFIESNWPLRLDDIPITVGPDGATAGPTGLPLLFRGAGPLALTGPLDIGLAPGFTPAHGAIYELPPLDANLYAWDANRLSIAATDAGAWQLLTSPDGGAVQVQYLLPEPTSLCLLAAGAAALWRRRKR